MAFRPSLLALLLSATCAAAWGQDPVGAEFRVNSSTTGHQAAPAVASDASGNFVVVWHSNGQDGTNWGVFGQRFSVSGVPQESEFRVNSYTTSLQALPAVASDANGSFVVIWRSVRQDFGDWSDVGQRFDASGVPQGGEFQVNSYTTSWVYGYGSAVASDANGNFVVVWGSNGKEGSDRDVFGRRFSAAGLPQGGVFQANSYTTGRQRNVAVASDANGNFVVVWASTDQDGSLYGVFGQRFDAAGLAQGSEFQVNSYTTNWQSSPAVASDANGNFVVVWHSYWQDGSDFGVFGQRFNAAGVPQGGEFPVNSYTTGRQTQPTVASDANGNFVVAWMSRYQDGSSYGVFGQRFNAAGLPQGSEFQVNSYTADNQRDPAVASNATGNFVVVWGSNGQDGSGYGVFGQRFGDLIFKNGFE